MAGGDRKKKAVIDKEETAESWCFVCKDGGDLRICDYRDCQKSYHSYCVKKDDSFLESENHWDCDWHTCSSCHRCSYLHCYTCTHSVCRRCLKSADFLRVKGQYGLCDPCRKLALLIEDGRDCDSDGNKVDFRDRETFEGLHMEYYVIIKEQEGFELGDLQARKHGVKTKKKFRSGSEESDDEYQISDYDNEDNARKSRKRKRCGRTKSRIRSSTQSNKINFVGWGSVSLIQFLGSIGKSSEQKLSQHDVASIVDEYVKENKLMHPEKRKMIMCDERLSCLFRKKMVNKFKVKDLLEAHFAENYEESDEDEVVYDTEDDDAGIRDERKKVKRKLDVGETETKQKEVADHLWLSIYAAIVAGNIKLVYLRRSLLIKMLKQPELFEKKVVGCFVRVKSDPYDYSSKSSHQLVQVRGVGSVSIDQNDMEATLLLSDMPKEVSIRLISDDDFSEEECADLRARISAGQLEKPKVEYLQQKANMIHADLTNHWISKQLALLQNLIDRANEKGWRRELFEYLERRRKLQNPSEVSKLLENVPIVIPDLEPIARAIRNDISSEKDSAKSILPCNSSTTNDVMKCHKASEEKTNSENVNPSKPDAELKDNESDVEICSEEASDTAVDELLGDDENDS